MRSANHRSCEGFCSIYCLNASLCSPDRVSQLLDAIELSIHGTNRLGERVILRVELQSVGTTIESEWTVEPGWLECAVTLY
jgi:hypothetical protein